jgi:hypothetical protein
MRAWWSVVVASAIAASASAQSLGEAARKEAERRNANKAAGVKARSFTDTDLPAAPDEEAADASAGPWSANEGSSGSSVPPSPRRGTEAAPSDRDQQEESWRKRMTDARTRVELLQQRRDLLAGQWLPPGLAGGLQARVAAAEKALAAAKQKLLDLEESARKQGVPPGWLR